MKNLRTLCFVFIVLVVMTGCQAKDTPTSPTEATLEAIQDARGPITLNSLDDLEEALGQMTLEEKAGQMIQAERGGISLPEIKAYNIGSVLSGGGSVPANNSPQGWQIMIERMQKMALASSSGIPLIYGIDAVHGHNNLQDAVIFPHNIGLGAANDADLMFKIGQEVAKDMKATGIHWNFSPAVSVAMDKRWGRTYESFGEQTDRVSHLSLAYMRGLHDQGIASTTKHFVGDGYIAYGTGQGDNLLDRGDVVMPLEDMLAVYLPIYQEAINQGTPTIMASFNSINGIKMHAHKALLTDLLRDQLGFRGVVISDWEAIHELEGSLEDQVATAVNAGVDMLMQPYNWKEVHAALVSNVNKGVITQERMDQAVGRILTLKFNQGLFTDPYQVASTDIRRPETVALAREAVAKSMVLLKNDQSLLPLKKDIKVYLIGPASDDVGVQCGGWTQSWQGQTAQDLYQGTSIKTALMQVLSANGGALVSTYEEADVVILALGEQPYAEMEGDTPTLALNHPKALEANLEAIDLAQQGDKPVVTLLVAGRPLLVKDYLDQWDAFVMAWLPGTEAQGITDVVFGDRDFRATMPVTWPLTDDQAADTFYHQTNDNPTYQFNIDQGLTP